MKEHGWIEPIVERVVGEVLESHAAQLRTEIVRRVMEEIAATEPASAEPTASEPVSHNAVPAFGAVDLARAVGEIQLGTSQKEILRALLDTSARYAARVALFVVKGSHATGWQARGFANSDAVKDFALDENAQAVAQAIRSRAAAAAPVADWDSRFLNDFGSPASGEGRILPLILKDKVAALVYADSGTAGAGLLDAGALDLLVLSTGSWLEVNSLRKQAQAHADSHGVPAAEASAHAPVHAVPAFNDPFASHAPAFATGHAMAAAASAGEAAAPVASAAVAAPAMADDNPQTAVAELQSEVIEEVVEMDSALAEPLPVADLGTEFVAPPEAPPVAAISPEDQDVHRKAQRFSRLLVDEIKLYNQAKVAEGRKNKDLYDRLKEAIEKSRGTYQKRYGNTVAASGNYFQHEIIRSLAEDDPSIMGANFRQ
jgi:predicted component of type VI protein secretion system